MTLIGTHYGFGKHTDDLSDYNKMMALKVGCLSSNISNRMANVDNCSTGGWVKSPTLWLPARRRLPFACSCYALCSKRCTSGLFTSPCPSPSRTASSSSSSWYFNVFLRHFTGTRRIRMDIAATPISLSERQLPMVSSARQPTLPSEPSQYSSCGICR